MKTLSELAEHMLTGQCFEVGLGDFLDAFYRSPNLAMVQSAPALLAERLPEGAVVDALLAAVAEHLCRRFALPIPAWVFQPARSRERPYFALPAAALRATLLLESPMEFRSRNLFVTANALSRASEHASPC